MAKTQPITLTPHQRALLIAKVRQLLVDEFELLWRHDMGGMNTRQLRKTNPELYDVCLKATARGCKPDATEEAIEAAVDAYEAAANFLVDSNSTVVKAAL